MTQLTPFQAAMRFGQADLKYRMERQRIYGRHGAKRMSQGPREPGALGRMWAARMEAYLEVLGAEMRAGGKP